MTELLYYQPGEMRGVSIQAGTPALEHDCSTTGGSGGAPLMDMESGF